jgi:HK97 family phage major capsid protein
VRSTGHPIIKFRDGAVSQFADVPYLLGKPVCLCPSMPLMGSTNVPIIFGNPWYFVARRVPSSMYVRAFLESTSLVQYGLVGFESWMRVDSNIVAANNSSYLPFQYLQNHS